MQGLNLIASGFGSSLLLVKLPKFESLVFKSEIKPKIFVYDGILDSEAKSLAVLHTIRREEKIIWESWEQLIAFGLLQAASKMRGMYRFQLLTLDFKQGHQSFNSQNFAQLVANLAKTMKVGDECLIQYTSIFGILKLKVETNWGKIDFEHGIQTFLEEPEKLDLFLKKMLTATDALQGRMMVVCDLSSVPILEPENPDQHERLAAWLQKIGDDRTAMFYMVASGAGFQLKEILKSSNGGG